MECQRCHALILTSDASITTQDGRKYHETCFRCTTCQKIIKEFIDVDGKPYCKGCHEANLALKCAGCGFVIDGLFTNAGKLGSYHPECFVCATCQTQLEGDFFHNPENNRLSCKSCKETMSRLEIRMAIGRANKGQ